MANNVNAVTVSGNTTRDPELRETKGGTPVCNLGIAVNRSRKDAEGEYIDEVSFFDVTVWGNYGSLVARKVKKGDHITVQGRLEQQRWEDAETGSKRSKVILIAEQIDGAAMYRSKDEDADVSPTAAPASDAPADSVAPSGDAAPAATPTEDDIPF